MKRFRRRQDDEEGNEDASRDWLRSGSLCAVPYRDILFAVGSH